MSNTQSHLIVTDEGLKIYKDDPASAILCEDQERAWEILAKQISTENSNVKKFTVSARQLKSKAEIGSIYPVPGIEFEETAIGQDCKHKYDPIPATCGTVNNCDCPYVTVARLIEHTAMTSFKKLTTYDESIRSVTTDHTEPIESPEIDKEEEQEHFIVDIWNASEEMQPKEFAEFVKGKYFINLKPHKWRQNRF